MFIYCADTACVINSEFIVALYLDDKAIIGVLARGALAPGAQDTVELAYYDNEKHAKQQYDELIQALARGTNRVWRLASAKAPQFGG